MAVLEVIALDVNAVGAVEHGAIVVNVDAPAHNEVVEASHLERTQK